MFIAVLFIIAPNWKQSKCPLTIDWINTWSHSGIPDSIEKE